MTQSHPNQEKSTYYRRLLPGGLLLLVCLAGMFFTLKAAQGYSHFFGSYHDDGIYTVCAKSLAAGRGYRIISLPNEPLETKYPLVFPCLLSLAFLLNPHFPANLPLLEGISSLMAILLVLLTGRFLAATGRATWSLALLVVAATWLNLNFLSFLPATMADLPTGLLCVAAIWLTERTVNRVSRSPRHSGNRLLPGKSDLYWVIIALAAIAALFTHVMGNFLITAIAVYLLFGRQYRGLLIFGAVYVLIAIPYFVWSQEHQLAEPAVMVYYTNYIQAAGYAAAYGGGFFQYVSTNLHKGFTDVIDITLQIFKSIIPADSWSAVNGAVYAFTWLLILLGLGHEILFRKRGRLLALWVTIHCTAHLLWPYGVVMRRVLVVLPFLYYFLFRGGRVLGYWLKEAMPASQEGKPRYRTFKQFTALTAISAAATILGGNVKEDLLWAGQYGLRIPPPTQAGPGYSETGEYQEAFSWIEKNTTNQDILVWNNDPSAYLLTGRKAIMACLGESWGVPVHPWRFITSQDILESIKFARGDYLIIDPISAGGLPGFTQLGTSTKKIIDRYPGSLTPVFTSKYGLITIFKIDRKRLQIPA